MHVILATIGTDGDVFPHIGLGAILRSRGHAVTLAGPEPYRELAVSKGLEFCSLVSTADVAQMLAHPDLFHPLRSGWMMAQWEAAFMPRQFEQLSELAGAPGCVLVANPGMLAARLVQEKVGCPTVTLLLQPGMVPSTSAPPVLPVGPALPRGLPRAMGELYWAGLDAAGYVMVARSLNRLRAGLGLRPVWRVFRWWLSPELVVGLFPEWYAPMQPDWPSQFRLVGFGNYDGDRGGELSDECQSFCQSGEPPIAFTMGTGMTHGARFFRSAVAACEAMGARGLLLTKFAHQIPRRLPASVRHVPFAPFRKLLPHCAAIVHHGGIGTTAAALAAGTPQLILPLAWDQPDNAARVRRLGVGDWLGPRHRSAGHLTRALARVLNPEVRARCAAIAIQAGAEDGLEAAAGWVEEVGNGRCGSSAPARRHYFLSPAVRGGK